MTVGELIRSAMLKIGVLDRFGEPTANEYSDGIIALNTLLRRIGVDRQGVHTTATVTHTTVASDGVYTVGPTGDIVTTRPHKIISCEVSDGVTDFRVKSLTVQEYRGIADKSSQGLPEWYYYDPTATNGTVYLYPVPDAAYTLSLTVQQPFTEYSSIATTITLPVEYQAHLPWGLAVDLAPEFGTEASSTVMGRAEETLRALKRLHSVVPRSYTDPLHNTDGDFDISSGVSGDDFLILE